MSESTLSRILLGTPLILGGLVVVALVIRTGKQGPPHPGEAPDAPLASSQRVSPAETYAAKLERVKRTLPAGHVIVESPPFVVVGDQPVEVVRKHVANNIHWSAALLKQLFFQRDPRRPIEIWLLSTPQSYARATQALFGVPPTTPYGFYVSARRTMVMNITTGGGTLVHELVHAYIEEDFPACPVWFNEGLGSLYEMVGERKGRIWGYVNWRLPRIQQAIGQQRALPFAKLMALDAQQFYGGASGLHYAQSRYLLYYLQVKGLLERYYRRFRARHRQDPTGLATLREVLGEPNLQAFQQRWEAYVTRLRVQYEVQVTMDDAQVRTLDSARER